MNVKELRDAIASLPDDRMVVLSKDGEGNGFSPLCEVVADMIYVADTTWSGDVLDVDQSAEEADMNENEREEFKRENPHVVLLWPTN